MFRRNTVFIVGAGASREVGLPTGAQLSDRISSMCEPAPSKWGDDTNRNLLFRVIQQQSGGDARKMAAWRVAMEDIRRALPFKDSIDAVIDQYHDRPEVAAIGKFMIAKLILEAEGAGALAASRDGFDEPDLIRTTDTWLHSFSRMLFEGLRKESLDEIGKNISIICFNYDRCIERHLTYSIAETYGLSIPEAIGVAARVRIVHAYGSLGALPGWPSKNGRPAVPFGGSGQELWEVAKNLQTFSESVDGETDEAIKSIIGAGEQYVYLGLSFGRQNMELLRSDAGMGNERDSFASGMGQYEQGRAAICRLIQQTYAKRIPRVPEGGPHPKTRLELNTTARQLLDLHWHNILS